MNRCFDCYFCWCDVKNGHRCQAKMMFDEQPIKDIFEKNDCKKFCRVRKANVRDDTVGVEEV